MNILVLSGARGVPLLGPSGASAHLRAVSLALAEAGHRVHIAVPQLTDARGAAATPLSLPITTLAPWRGRRLGRWRERAEVWHSRRLMDRALAECGFTPDLLWERHSLHADAGLRWSARTGVPRLTELNAPLALERQRTDPVRDPAFAKRLERQLLRGAHRVLAVSSWLHGWAIHDQGCAPERVLHLPNGTSLRASPRRAQTRARLGLHGLVLLFVGSCKPWHHLALLPALLDELPEARALVVGAGPAPPPPHPRLQRLPPADPEALADLIAAADVGLSPHAAPRLPWVCPLKLLDYHSQGLPVVATPVGDTRTLLAPRHAPQSPRGLLVESLNPRAWAQAIRAVAGQRHPPYIRAWSTVVEEALRSATGP